MNDYKHLDLTGMIIGCAIKVHKVLGSGFPEVIYQKCLMIELEKAGLKYDCQVEKRIFYEGVDVGGRRLDLIVENVVIIELKAIRVVESICVSQLLNYLDIFKIEVGLLINFGNKSLQYNRYAKSINDVG